MAAQILPIDTEPSRSSNYTVLASEHDDEYALVNELTMACMAHLAKQTFPEFFKVTPHSFCTCTADGTLSL